jgi:hypothetical protein
MAAAAKRRDLGWDPIGDSYDGACALARCIPIVEKQEPATDARAAAIQFYGDAAVKMLQVAVDKGWNNAAHMKKDSDLDSLRQRDDFQKLMAELEKKQAGKPEKNS